MKFFAHSGNSGKESNKSDWQTLAEHSENVARLAAQMASVFGCENAAFAAGLFHDLGKYNPAFQRRLEGASIRVDHSTAGAALLLSLAEGRNHDFAKLIAYVIAGHHAGLPDMISESRSLSERLKDFKDELDVVWKDELTFDLEALVPQSISFSKDDKRRVAFQLSFLTRMIFSCLVDSDYKDTEAFYDKLENRERDREWQLLQKLLPQFTNAFDAKMNAMSKADTEVNRLRTDILNHVRTQAPQKPGLFTLTVPTGGGKTLASLGFALDHAKLHGHDRIIYAIPFTSIIDQTAAIFSELLGAEHILEHHSAIYNEANEKGQRRDWRDKLKLAMEDWAAPIVVTTNVQFFESLFASRTSASRKLHNIANSVIILDEAQTIPRHLLSPCMRVLDELAKNYKCSIVLCTATQPATDARNFSTRHPAGLPLEGRELAPDPHHLANSLRRVIIQKPREMSNDDLVSELQQTSQGLIIVNSRKHALALYQVAQKSGMDGLVHLTTRQCAVDRRKILAQVRMRLADNQFCRVIATSLVEAGVDVDFPRVWRAEAGLDQIAQAAGRCNREGKRLDSYINRVTRAVHTAGHVNGSRKSSFSGSRIGRGSAFGTLAAAGLYPGGQRRVIVKARITKFKAGQLGAARAHLRYIQRDGVTPEGEPGQLYGPDTDQVNGTTFLDDCGDDRHQFRLIVSPEDGAQLHDLKPFIRDFMAKVESDLEIKLDWVAVDHYNTGHPHTHIIIRGKDDKDQDQDLIMTKDYVSHGLRLRARELLTLELGPEDEGGMVFKLAREVDSERFTRLDRALLKHTDRGFLVMSAMLPEDRDTHASHMGRLRKLQNLGLALERQTGVWQISTDFETKLKSLGQRGDIIKTMHRTMRETGIDRPAGSFAMFDTTKPSNRIVGRVAGLGLTDEINDRHYIVVDAIDGKVHYADVGHLRPEFVPDKAMIVAIENKVVEDSDKQRTRLRILSYLNLEKLVDAEGATWLDKELLGKSQEKLAQAGFGSNVAAAIARRRQWLVTQGLGTINSANTFHPQPRMLEQLRQRDLRQASQILSKELGLTHAQLVEGERIAGTFNRTVNLASGKYAVIQKSKEFTLVPWRPEFEQFRGKSLSGATSSQGINWDWNAKRGLAWELHRNCRI